MQGGIDLGCYDDVELNQHLNRRAEFWMEKFVQSMRGQDQLEGAAKTAASRVSFALQLNNVKLKREYARSMCTSSVVIMHGLSVSPRCHARSRARRQSWL